MAERYFPNKMPHYIPEETPTINEETANKDSLSRLLSLPYHTLRRTLQASALHLKDMVVRETWGLSGKRVQDYSVYTGVLGTAYLLFKAYEVTKNENDLHLCSQIINACDSASAASRHVTFICGRAGVYALGAVVAKYADDPRLLDYYLKQFKEIKFSNDVPNELLYGRAGFLWACLFIDKHIGKETIATECRRAVVDEMIKAGRTLALKDRCPLMYEWHGKKYWGAAHGLAGIMHVLMDMELKPDEIKDVKGTLRYMIKNRFASGNYPSSEGNESDRLVHWCHGAPGVALTLVKAAEVFGDEEFFQAAVEAGELVWNRGLLKRVGICHGISGNTYVFLSLYRLTGNPEYLYKAKAFACFLQDRAQKLISEGTMHGGDCPYSLFEGFGGMAYLFFDMAEPSEARFPAYEL
ncbi:lanC-like protein GCR2 isoform X2 [Mercurialis annua]|uniref:lanC-like protein GCR2 isoform X2 n=1 Tax=Mercurialis annua TaxID=3986 RepID=UPI00215F725E|nr:lanC-like protein GCR2 isoform X2 [Mercurialis annua]